MRPMNGLDHHALSNLLARFKEPEDNEFSEYDLLGTSASLPVALFAGTLTKIISNM